MISITINTQTPPIRFNLNYQDLLSKYGYLELPIQLEYLDPSDYHVAVGGVAKMMIGLLRNIKFSKSRWVALGPGYPPAVKFMDTEVHFVDPPTNILSSYTRFKECIYNESHNISSCNIISSRDYLGYANYNWISAQKLLEFYDETDVYLINDFQQLLVGGIIGPSAPAVLWYHIPFIPQYLNPRLREFIVKSFEAFDYVVLSTKRDLEGLVRVGAKVKAKQIYPFIDPREFQKVPDSEIKKAEEKYGISQDDTVVLLVGRMDPMKSQDVAIKAIKDLNVKLVLVGNGSFTSKTLGHDKASTWLRSLYSLVKELKVEDKVIFTGYVDHETLQALYQRSNVVILTSKVEGFGLTICEAWTYGKPVVVSSGAGVSELVIEGGNGYVFKREDYEDLREKIKLAIRNGDKFESLAKETVKKCSIDYASRELYEVLQEAKKEYSIA